MATENINVNSQGHAEQPTKKTEPNEFVPLSDSQQPSDKRGSETPESRKLPISPFNVVLAGMFAVGVLTLYLLNLRTGVQTASAEQQKIELRVDTALEQIKALTKTKTGSKETDAIIDTFYYEARQRQIPLEHLSGNPFIYVPLQGEALSQGEKIRIDPVQQELADAMELVKQLKLQSVLTGPQGQTAMISNNLVAKNQVIYGWKVERISTKEVTLSWRDQEFVLKMPR